LGVSLERGCQRRSRWSHRRPWCNH
jgi:hypothetical protein